MKYLLSLFIDFGNFGYLIWIVIPLFLYLSFNQKNMTRGHRSIFFAVSLSYICVAISTKGYVRHIFTFYPFLLGAIFLLGWEFINKRKWIKIAAFITISLACAYSLIINNELFVFHLNENISAEKRHFPYNVLNYVNNEMGYMDSQSPILVCEGSYLFAYITKKRIISQFDIGMNDVYSAGDKEQALDILKNRLKVNYIFVQWNQTLNPYLIQVISENCDLIIQDKRSGFYLYKIRERDLSKKEVEYYFPNESLVSNGSFELWARGATMAPDSFEKGDNIIPGMVTREEKDIKVGRFAARIKGDNFNFGQDINDSINIQGKPITGFVWMKTDVPQKYRMQIYDGISSSFSNWHSGNGRWELLQINYIVDKNARNVSFRVVQAEKRGRPNDTVIVDGALLVEGDWNTFYLYSKEKDHKAAIN